MDKGLHNSDWVRLADATEMAISLHRGRLAPGSKTPYLAHVFAVLSLVLEHTGDEDLAIAAVLQSPFTKPDPAFKEEIIEKFGPWTAAIVNAAVAFYPHDLADIVHLQKQSADILLIICAEMLHTARFITNRLRTEGTECPFQFDEDNRQALLWYYATLADCFSMTVPGTMPSEFAIVVQEMRTVSNRLSGSDYLASLDQTL